MLVIILIRLFLNGKLDLIWTVKFVKQLFRIQIQKGGKVLLWNQVKSKKEGGYSEQVLDYKSAELKDVHTYSKYKCSAE